MLKVHATFSLKSYKAALIWLGLTAKALFPAIKQEITNLIKHEEYLLEALPENERLKIALLQDENKKSFLFHMLSRHGAFIKVLITLPEDARLEALLSKDDSGKSHLDHRED